MGGLVDRGGGVGERSGEFVRGRGRFGLPYGKESLCF